MWDENVACALTLVNPYVCTNPTGKESQKYLWNLFSMKKTQDFVLCIGKPSSAPRNLMYFERYSVSGDWLD